MTWTAKNESALVRARERLSVVEKQTTSPLVQTFRRQVENLQREKGLRS